MGPELEEVYRIRPWEYGDYSPAELNLRIQRLTDRAQEQKKAKQDNARPSRRGRRRKG